MKTLVIYDNTGYIYLQITGCYILPQGGLNYLEVQIPEGKTLKSIDTSVTLNVPVYEDVPVSEIDNLKQQVTDLQNYIIEKESAETTSL
jgi:hypothetical protein